PPRICVPMVLLTPPPAEAESTDPSKTVTSAPVMQQNPAATTPRIIVSPSALGACVLSVRKVDPDRYEISFPAAPNWFILKVTGARGHTLQFDFKGVKADRWASMQPLCVYADNLAKPELYI